MRRRAMSVTVHAALIILALALSTAACRPGEQRAAEADTGPLIADSSGVRIVSDTAPAWGDRAPWTVAAEPTLDIGAPDFPFQGVGTLRRLGDGRLLVVNGVTQTINYFDRGGKLVRTVGGRGTEEGQFHGLGWVGLAPGDTVVAYDFIARKLVLFDSKGTFARAADLRPADPEVAAEPVASYPDGSVLFRLMKRRGPLQVEPGTVVRDSATYMRFDLTGSPVVLIGEFPQGEYFGVRVRSGEPVVPFPLPYGLVTMAATRGDTTLVGTGASFEIASFGPAGAPVGLLRAAISRAPLTEEEESTYTAAAITRIRTGAKSLHTTLDSAFLRALEHPPFPERKPAFGRLIVDATGALWVSEPVTATALPTVWTIFAPDGDWLGRVTTPEGFRVDEIGADYILGVWRERHGGERVRSYPLTRGAAN